MAEVLGERGYRVIVAGDAASALQAIATADGLPDVVLLDLRLPDSNRSRRAVRHPPLLPRSRAIVLMTAHGTPELFDEARRRGAAAVMDKPFEIGDVAPMVERRPGRSRPPVNIRGAARAIVILGRDADADRSGCR